MRSHLPVQVQCAKLARLVSQRRPGNLVRFNALQDMVDAEKAAKTGKKVKKKKKKKAKKGKKGKKEKKKKDPTADRALEHLYVEMVSAGILQQCPKVRLHAVGTGKRLRIALTLTCRRWLGHRGDFDFSPIDRVCCFAALYPAHLNHCLCCLYVFLADQSSGCT